MVNVCTLTNYLTIVTTNIFLAVLHYFVVFHVKPRSGMQIYI